MTDRSAKEEVIQLTKSYIWKTRYSRWLKQRDEEKAMMKFVSQAAWDDSSDFSIKKKKNPKPKTKQPNKPNLNP